VDQREIFFWRRQTGMRAGGRARKRRFRRHDGTVPVFRCKSYLK
jgi:hypothetical protein